MFIQSQVIIDCCWIVLIKLLKKSLIFSSIYVKIHMIQRIIRWGLKVFFRMFEILRSFKNMGRFFVLFVTIGFENDEY